MNIENLVLDLKENLKEHAQKPYLPHWGNIFSILYTVKKTGDKYKQDIIFYQIQPSGILKYDYHKKAFIAEILEISIKLSINQLTDSLLQNRFLPKE